MTQITMPTVTDDDGSKTSGTVFNASFFSSIESGINALVHSSSNPAVTPADIIDEVVAARGNKSDLDTRISSVIDDDGALLTPASLVSSSNLTSQAASSLNLWKNSTFFLWSAGLSSAPDYYSVSNGSVVMAGTGQGDTTRKVGKYCAKLTWSSGTAKLEQVIVDTTDFANLDHLGGETKKVGFGAWIKASVASQARLQFDDGVDTTESDYHTGGGSWEYIGAVHTMSGSATKMTVNFQMVSSGSAYVSGGTCYLGDYAPTLWVPERVVRGSVTIYIPGTLTTGDGKRYFSWARPIRIDQIWAHVLTDPTGASLDVDFEKFEPTTTWVSMLAGGAGALIDNGDGVGVIAGTTTAADYDHRCLSGLHTASGELSASGQEDKLARLNIDQVGSTVAGADLFLRVDGVQCMHPFEDQLSADFLGV